MAMVKAWRYEDNNWIAHYTPKVLKNVLQSILQKSRHWFSRKVNHSSLIYLLSLVLLGENATCHFCYKCMSTDKLTTSEPQETLSCRNTDKMFWCSEPTQCSYKAFLHLGVWTVVAFRYIGFAVTVFFKVWYILN